MPNEARAIPRQISLGSKNQVVAVDGSGRYVGLALVADAHATDIQASGGLIACFISATWCCIPA